MKEKTVSMSEEILNLKILKEFLAPVGEEAIRVVEIFISKNKGLLDEEICKILGVKVTVVRATLNKLHYLGIVSYDTEKNKETGWYTYTWNLDKKKLLKTLLERALERFEKIKEEENMFKERDFFTCKKKCDNYVFEIAMEYNFFCPSCGGKMTIMNRGKTLKKLEREVKNLETEIKKLRELNKVFS